MHHLLRSIPSKANNWISKRVYLINQSIKVRQNRLKHFLDIYLEQDGIFMIRMIANNTSDYVATDLIHHLCNFDFYLYMCEFFFND